MVTAVAVPLRLTALRIALGELKAGAREIPTGSNLGPFVAKYLKPAGLTPPQPYCASAMSWIFLEAAKELDLPMPFHYSPGALNLFHACQDKGWEIKQAARVQPADLIFWHRGPTASGLGHVEIVEFGMNEGRLQTIGFNHTSQVDTFHYDQAQWKKNFVGFIRVPG